MAIVGFCFPALVSPVMGKEMAYPQKGSAGETLVMSRVNKITTDPPSIPLPTNGAIWNVVRNRICPFPGGRWNYSVRTNGDTFIGNKTYSKLDIPFYQADPASLTGCVSSQPGIYAGAFRQDSLQQKVYFIPPGNIRDTLLYDFSLAVGDTLKGYLGGSFATPYSVVSIDSVSIENGSYRKRWNLRLTGCPPTDVLEIVEGIGSMDGLISQHIPCFADVDWDALMCMSVGNVNQYLAPGQTSCNLITSHEFMESSRTFSLYPNPVTQNQLTASFTEKGSLTLFDARGRIVFQKANIQGTETLPVSLKSGFYFATIQTAKGRKSVKVVVE